MDDRETKGRRAIQRRRVANFIEDLRCDILREESPLEAAFAPSEMRLPLRDTIGLDRRPVREGEAWGRTWDSGYFRLVGRVPLAWKGKAVAARLDFGGEGLIYSKEGEPLYGITDGSAFAAAYSKDVYRLHEACAGGEDVELFVEAAANGLFGLKPASRPASKSDPGRHGSYEARVRCMRLCIFDTEAWGLYLDMDFLSTLLDSIDPESTRAARILRALFEVASRYREDPANAAACRGLLALELGKRADASALSTTVVGHAHIDTAWLWPLAETRRKVARTFASQLSLIGRYPGYVFGASSPQHYAWMKGDHPGLYARMRKAVAEGRWEPQGGMWIEADCNLISGESFVRQFLRGQNFWMDEFGAEVKNCWLPDVFGYPASMPQILRKSGVDFFLTQKMSWSKHNEFPHDTFRWRGIDGSEVLTHFPPEYTYNSYGTPDALIKAERTFHEKSFVDEFITLLGIGDGGGGPKEEHLEHAIRARDSEGLPKAALGRADALFARLARMAPELEAWVGELYLEYHRGTYTTQAANKRNNRRLEQELRAVEALWSCLPLADYPGSELGAVVESMLLHQFHDILPGSSIRAVYEESDSAYAAAFASLAALRDRAAGLLLEERQGALTLFNCLSFPWEGALELPEGMGARGVTDAEGAQVPSQLEGGRLVARVSVPPLGFAALLASDAARGPARSPAPQAADPLRLENDLVLYRFDEDGQLVEAWDKEARRSVLRPGQRGNVISYYQDTPHDFEAWDIDYYYPSQLLETAKGMSHEALEGGRVRRGIAFELRVGHSAILQRIRLEEGDKLLRFDTRVEWRESQRLLRVSFPLDSVATEAACEIAYGHIMRPTHANTEWDFAKFEVCAHRWVDISDSAYGVALLNDCKYGHSLLGNVLSLSLLRSPLHPDPDADLGRQEFAYALLPHAGSLAESRVVERAAALNRPPLAFRGMAGSPTAPLALIGEGISLEAVKKAEKEEALVLRLVETRGIAAEGRLLCSLPGARICETDLIERRDGPEEPLVGSFPLRLAPFEIRTYKVRRGGR